MGFYDNLTHITGIEEVDGIARLIGETPFGQIKFHNSGIGLWQLLDRSKLDYKMAGDESAGYFRQGKRFNPTILNMPVNCLDQVPHCHPGGEFAYVVQGEYFDADMEGEVICSYPAGSVVFYNIFSTHRPLSRDGAQILYIPFDGIVFGKDPLDLANKMIKVGTTPAALEYAMTWMVPDKQKRQELIDESIRTVHPSDGA